MLTRPDAIADATILHALQDGWAFDAVTVEYLRAGFGSHHWVARAADGTRRFVTVDDLASRDFLGSDPSPAFDGLTRAFTTARALRDAGLSWVVGPSTGTDGQVLGWLQTPFSIAVFPYVDGVTTAEYRSDSELADVIPLLAEMHQRTGQVVDDARRQTFRLPNRADLEIAIAQVAGPWTAGPYSEPARHLLAEHLEGVRGQLADYDRLAEQALEDPGGWTITHGEPHSRNVMRTDAGPRVIDWDTALIAPPERDLWMLAPTASHPVAQQYTAATGHEVRPALLRLYGLMWDLDEIGGYLARFRSSHTDDDDSAESWRNLQHFIRGYQRA